jgi:caa(3)-type oxidase subunit IV
MQQPVGHDYSLKTIVATWVGLLILTALMVGISRIPLPESLPAWAGTSTPDEMMVIPLTLSVLHWVKALVILSIAVVMGAIVALFLMGLRYEKTYINVVVFGANFAFLAIFVAFTWADITFRGEMDTSFEKQINWESPILKANEAAEAKGGSDSSH